MEDNFLICSVCSLPTPLESNTCIHCGNNIKHDIKRMWIAELWKYASYAMLATAAIMYAIYISFHDIFAATSLALLKLSALYLTLFDMGMDKNIKHFKLKHYSYNRIKKAPIVHLASKLIKQIAKRIPVLEKLVSKKFF